MEKEREKKQTSDLSEIKKELKELKDICDERKKLEKKIEWEKVNLFDYKK